MKRPTMWDLELADTIQAELLRVRLRSAVSTDDLIDEDQYVELVAREIERARKARENQKGEAR